MPKLPWKTTLPLIDVIITFASVGKPAVSKYIWLEVGLGYTFKLINPLLSSVSLVIICLKPSVASVGLSPGGSCVTEQIVELRLIRLPAASYLKQTCAWREMEVIKKKIVRVMILIFYLFKLFFL